MRISDYNAMRQMAGVEPVLLGDDQFFMHIDYEMDMERTVAGIDSIDSRYIRLDDGTTLQLAETAVYNDRLGTYMFNMDSTVLVFPDSACDTLLLARTCYYADTDTVIPYGIPFTVRLKAHFKADTATCLRSMRRNIIPTRIMSALLIPYVFGHRKAATRC